MVSGWCPIYRLIMGPSILIIMAPFTLRWFYGGAYLQVNYGPSILIIMAPFTLRWFRVVPYLQVNYGPSISNFIMVQGGALIIG